MPLDPSLGPSAPTWGRRYGVAGSSFVDALYYSGTCDSPEYETEIQLSDKEKLGDPAEADILYSRQALARSLAIAANRALLAIADGAEGAGTGQLADLAYAFACVEGARRGVLPATPPPPKMSAPAGPLNDNLGAELPRQPTSSPQPGPGLPPFGDTTRTYR